MRIAINGLGRIGRSFLRASAQFPELEIVAINDPATARNLAHLLKYDTVHGPLPGTVQAISEEVLRINAQEVQVSHTTDPKKLPWQELELDLILESSGRFLTADATRSHQSMARWTILSAPPKDETKTIVMGANQSLIQKDDKLLSCASCTTNSVAPLLEVVDAICGIEHAFITTVHSYTTDQQLQDGPHKDFRRGRAAAESIVPTTTGAAKAITKIYPRLEGRIGGAGIRVPVPDGSLTDITFTVREAPLETAVNEAFWQASQKGPWKDYLGYTNDPIVSRDVIGSPYSCLFDEELTTVLGPMVKVVGWYDNEWGYSHRLCDLVRLLAQDFL
jgi:glyceraldehyde 3-phosphate dehydrogenase